MNVFRILWWPIKKRLHEATAPSPPAQMTLEEYERLDPIVKVQDGDAVVIYGTPNRLAKEPDTVEWIMPFVPGDVLVDIVPNVGMYTIWAAKTRVSRFAQVFVSTTLDHLVESGVAPIPTHIKIDVDGLEHKVLACARATLRDSRLKSVLIAINSNLDELKRIVQELVDLGFRYPEEQVLAARRTVGPSTGTGNYVFRC